MNHDPMNIVIAINQKYVRYAYVMLTSLLWNNPISVRVYILHRDLSSEDEESFQSLVSSFSVSFHFIFVPDHLTPPSAVLATSAWGPEAYFRLAVADLLPDDVTRVLYLDTDMIIHHSIEDFYNCELHGNKIAACKEFVCNPPFNNYRDELFAPLFTEGFSYFNSGTILYDLSAMRMTDTFSAYMDTARELHYKIQFPDQDLLNYRHYNETLFADTMKYNLNARCAYNDYHMRYDDMNTQGVIIHYASSKPWRGNFIHCDVEQIWWDYAAKTPYYDSLLTDFLKDTMMDATINSYVLDLTMQNTRLYALLDEYEQLLRDAGISL